MKKHHLCEYEVGDIVRIVDSSDDFGHPKEGKLFDVYGEVRKVIKEEHTDDIKEWKYEIHCLLGLPGHPYKGVTIGAWPGKALEIVEPVQVKSKGKKQKRSKRIKEE